MLALARSVRQDIRIRPRRVIAATGAKIGKQTHIIFNNPRSSIKPGSAPDPFFLIFKTIIQDTLRSRSPMRGHIERDPRTRKESMLRNRSLDGLTTLTGTLSKQLGKRFSRSGHSMDENDSVV